MLEFVFFLCFRAHKKAKLEHDNTWHLDMLPAVRSHEKLLLRVVVVIKKRATNRVHVLLSERTAWHLPICEINPTKSLHSTLRRFMIELFGADVPSHRPHGCLSVRKIISEVLFFFFFFSGKMR